MLYQRKNTETGFDSDYVLVNKSSRCIIVHICFVKNRLEEVHKVRLVIETLFYNIKVIQPELIRSAFIVVLSTRFVRVPNGLEKFVRWEQLSLFGFARLVSTTRKP